MRHYQKDLNLLDVVMTTPFDPYGSMRHLLLERTPPPYTLLTLIVLFVVLVVPSIAFQYLHGLMPFDVRLPYAIASTLCIALVLFIPANTLLLRLFGFSASLRRSAAMCAYSVTPLIPLALVYYVANYAVMGELTVLEFLSTGLPVSGDWLVKIFPYFTRIGAVWSFFVFAQAVHALGDSSRIVSTLLTTMSVALLALACYVGWISTDAIFPDTAFIVKHFFTSLVSAPGCPASSRFC